MFQWLKDWLAIYLWSELWMVVSVPVAIMGVWFLFCLLIGIPNSYLRAIAIWSLFLTLALGATTVDALRKRRK